MTWSTESRQKRGYDAAWTKLRLAILKRDNYICHCDQCRGGKNGGRVTPATEVHHKTSKAEARRLRWTREQMDDPGNLQAINTDCHKRVTAEQQGKTYRGVKGCDATGRPLDPAHHWNTGGAIFSLEAVETRTDRTTSVQDRQSGGERDA